MTTKDNPFISRLLNRTLLNKPGSSKATFHIELKADPHIDYAPGDALAILPANSKLRVNHLLSLLKKTGEEFICYRGGNYALKDFLTYKANIDFIPLKLLNLFPHGFTDKIEAKTFAEGHHLESLLIYFGPIELDLALFIESIPPLLPRLYSIASSKLVQPGQIDLIVSALFYEKQGQTCIGVGSDFLCYSAIPLETPIPFYIQKSPHFKLPSDPFAKLVMIGPGTGIAPYRAFLQERSHYPKTGEHWLFFGERNRAYDYYYEAFWQEFQSKHSLEIDTAFSRDQEEKVYVQHKIKEKGALLWKWLQEGAHLYICGDASSMAKEVQKTLVDIAQNHGKLTEEEAHLFFKNLRKESRFSLDVY